MAHFLLASLLALLARCSAKSREAEESGLLQLRKKVVEHTDFRYSLDETYDRSLLSMILPEPRALSALPLVVLHAHAHFPELQIQILHSAVNKEYVASQPILAALQLKGAVTLTPLPEPFYRFEPLNTTQYSKMLEAEDFWKLPLTRKVLLIQTDSWFCSGAREHLKEFLDYDYVGAPLEVYSFTTEEELKCQGAGNGGFSLRDRDAMLRAIQNKQQKEAFQVIAEDRFFCAQSELMSVAQRQAAMNFARNQKLHDEANFSGSLPKIVGVHQLVGDMPWAYKRAEVEPMFAAHCPGVSLMVNAGSAQDPAFTDLLLQEWQQQVLPTIPAAPADVDEILSKSQEAGFLPVSVDSPPSSVTNCWASLSTHKEVSQPLPSELGTLWQKRLELARSVPARRTLIIYSGPFVTDPTFPATRIYQQNLKYFMKYGACPNELVTTLVVVGPQVNVTELAAMAPEVTWLQRGPNCYDFEAYKVGLKHIGEGLKDYENFVFLNCGLAGPFLPATAMGTDIHWSRYFTSRLSDKVKLVGISMSNSANPPMHEVPHNHVQSMLWATDSTGLQVIIKHFEQDLNIDMLSGKQADDVNMPVVWPSTRVRCRAADSQAGEFVEWQRDDFVNHAEVLTSQSMFDGGYAVAAISQEDHNMEIGSSDAPELAHRDYWYPNAYLNHTTIGPFDAIFMKVSRPGIGTPMVDSLVRSV